MEKHYRKCNNCKSFGPYDYNSLMHYPIHLGSQNRTVITVKEGLCEGSSCTIGQREGLSSLDVDDIQIFYDCGRSISGSIKLIASQCRESKLWLCTNLLE